jgi:endogenous inhibitor of DNA gyrase (YacG/DUF329 family)
MFCPNCGQQQVSDEMRFCSRCGLALTGLAEWLAGGMLVRRAEEPALPSRQRKAIRRAAKLMFFSAAMFPIFFAISYGIDEPGPLFVPLVPFFLSGVWMLYARLFMDETPQLNPAPPPARIASRTNELIQVPSVTEHTTKLLDTEHPLG